MERLLHLYMQEILTTMDLYIVLQLLAKYFVPRNSWYNRYLDIKSQMSLPF